MRGEDILGNGLYAISNAGEDGGRVLGAGGYLRGRDVSRGRAEVSAEAGHPGVQTAGRVVPAIRQTAEHRDQVRGARADRQPGAAIEQSLEVTQAETRGRHIAQGTAGGHVLLVIRDQGHQPLVLVSLCVAHSGPRPRARPHQDLVSGDQRGPGVQLTRVETGVSLGQVPDHEHVHLAPGLMEDAHPLRVLGHHLVVDSEQRVLAASSPPPGPGEAVSPLVADHTGDQGTLTRSPPDNLRTECTVTNMTQEISMKKGRITWLDVNSKEGLMGSGGGRKTFFRFDNVFSSRRRLSIPV